MIILPIVATWLGTKLAEKTFDSIYTKYLDKAESLDDELKASIDKVAQNLFVQYPDILDSSIAYFFKKEEVFNNLIKILFSYSNDDILEFSNKYFDLNTLPEFFISNFISQLKSDLQNKINFSQLLNDKELFIAVRGIHEDIERIASNSTLAYNQLKEIKELLSDNFPKNHFDYYSFFNTYKTVAFNNLSQVTFLGLGVESHIKRSRKKLKDIFVKPNFLTSKINNKNPLKHANVAYDSKSSEIDIHIGSSFKDDVLISTNEVFDNNKNLVILGDPGSGKSFIVKYIVCSLLLSNNQNFNNQNIFSYLPIRIELRKYLNHKRSHSCNLNGYMIHLFEDEYNITLNVSNIDFILKNRNTLMLFDGLDEIFDITDKNQIKNDIESFCLTNTNVRAIVTSRFIGYSEARLNEDIFDEIQIQQFNDNQIVEYVRNWYHNEEQDDDIRSREIQEFLDKKSRLDNELTKNPLLLSLIVILFRNNLKLPESKLEIYQSCTKTLVEKWDESKKLEIGLDETLLKKKETIFADLAYWQYQALSSKSNKITYQKAKRTIADCLVNKIKISDDLIEAIDLAGKFLSYAENRSIYFDNNFTHKTFLEYYTAYWIYSNYDKKQLSIERDKLITKFIENSFWSIVLELLLNLIDSDQPDNDIIDKIYTEQSKNTNAIPFLIEVLPTIENISTYQKAEVIKKGIDKILRASNSNKEYATFSKNSFFNIFKKSVLQNDALIKVFSKVYLAKAKEVSTTEDAITYFTLGYELTGPRIVTNSLTKNDIYDLVNSEPIYIDIYNKDPYLWLLKAYYTSNANDYNFNNIIEFITLFGLELFFEDYEAKFDSYHLIGLHHYFLMNQVKYDSVNFKKNFDILVKLGLNKKKAVDYYKTNVIFNCSEEELQKALIVYNTSILDYSTKSIIRSVIIESLNRKDELITTLKDLLPLDILKNVV